MFFILSFNTNFGGEDILSRPEIGLHKNVNLWELEFMKTKRA